MYAVFGDRMVTDSKSKLLESLTDDEKSDGAPRVFKRSPCPQKADGATLLLPRSFVADGLMTQAEQDAMFKSGGGKNTPLGRSLSKTPPRGTRRITPPCSPMQSFWSARCPARC